MMFLKHYKPIAVGSLFVLFSLFASGVAYAADEKVTGRLIVEDVLMRPGTPIMLKARLVHDGLLGATGLGGETISFMVQGQHAGTALTGGDGRAFLEFKTHMRGNHKIVAKVEPSSRVNAVEGLGNLASWERRKPLLFVDFFTLVKKESAAHSPLSKLPFSLGVAALGDPAEDASHELTKLGAFYYNIIYLFRTEGKGDTEELREWLNKYEFPAGITRVIKPGPQALLSFIEKLKEMGWDNVEAGIGRTKGFADTLVKNRIKTVIFPDPSEKNKYPRRAKIVENWKAVRKHL